MIFDNYNITVYTSMVNDNKDLKPQAVLDIFQYGAVKQSQAYHIDGPSIIDKGVIWVIISIHYEVLKHNTGEGEYVLKTWPRKSNSKIKHLRDYILCDKEGNEIIKGTSTWCLIDLKTNFPVYRPDICFPDELSDDKVFIEETKRIVIDNSKITADPEYFPILKSYYDSNKHTNNAVYGMFIYELLNKKSILNSLTIDFISQTFVGDKLKVYSYKNAAEPQYFVGYVDEKLIFKALVEEEK